MSLSTSVWWKVGCLSGASAVVLGAFGAHGLQARGIDPKLLKTWDTAVQYHFIHSIALCLVPFAASTRAPAAFAGKLFIAGIGMFSGSLYGIVLTGNKSFGPITPLGGLCFIAGWVALAFGQ